MEKTIYEHKVLLIHDTLDSIAKKLDNLSIDGWELVSVVEDIHYLRRPKKSSVYHVNPKTGNYEIKEIIG